MKKLLKKTLRLLPLLVCLYSIFLLTQEAEAQSFVRKRYRIHMGLEGSGLGLSANVGYHMNVYFLWRLNYYYISEKNEEISKSGNHVLITVDYFPFQRSNFFMGLGIGSTSTKWSATYCEDYVQKTGCENFDISFPTGIKQARIGFLNVNVRTKFTVTFMLHYTLLEQPSYLLDDENKVSAAKTRFQDEVDDYVTQTGLLFGLGYLM